METSLTNKHGRETTSKRGAEMDGECTGKEEEANGDLAHMRETLTLYQS